MRRIQPYGFLCYSVAILMKMHYFYSVLVTHRKVTSTIRGIARWVQDSPCRRTKGGGRCARIKLSGLCAFSVAFNRLNFLVQDMMGSFPCYVEKNYPRYMAISAPGVVAFILEGLYLLSRSPFTAT